MRRLRPQLYIGPSVHPADVPRLHGARISAVVSLQEPDADLPGAAVERMRAACEPRIAFRNVAIRDYDPEAVIAALPAAVTTLLGLVGAGRVVYLHCSEGINRAPSVALAYLVAREALAVDAALRELRACEPAARPYPAVVQWLRNNGARLAETY